MCGGGGGTGGSGGVISRMKDSDGCGSGHGRCGGRDVVVWLSWSLGALPP